MVDLLRYPVVLSQKFNHKVHFQISFLWLRLPYFHRNFLGGAPTSICDFVCPSVRPSVRPDVRPFVPNFVRPKTCSSQNLLIPIYVTNHISRQTHLGTNIFWDEQIWGRTYFWDKHILGRTCLGRTKVRNQHLSVVG